MLEETDKELLSLQGDGPSGCLGRLPLWGGRRGGRPPFHELNVPDRPVKTGAQSRNRGGSSISFFPASPPCHPVEQRYQRTSSRARLAQGNSVHADTD